MRLLTTESPTPNTKAPTMPAAAEIQRHVGLMPPIDQGNTVEGHYADAELPEANEEIGVLAKLHRLVEPAAPSDAVVPEQKGTQRAGLVGIVHRHIERIDPIIKTE
ncbi:MAG: hypothetical protein V4671_25590, partial [Armatimonadota bacterium]